MTVTLTRIAGEQAITFLSHPAPSQSRWQPVLDHLRQQPHSPLAQALSTPLMVVLAHIAYRDPTTTPATLLELRDRDSVTRVLIDRFVTRVYQAEHPTPRTVAKTHRLQAYDPDRAARWLSFLAYHLYQTGTRDLWWWQLSPGLLTAHPSRVQRLVPVLATLIAAGVAAVGTHLAAGAWLAVRAAVVTTVVVAVSASGLFRSLWPGGYPPYVDLRYRTPRRRRVYDIGLRMAFGVVFGLMTGLLVSMPLLGLTAGLLSGLVMVVTPEWSVSSRARRSTPLLTVRANHRTAATAAAWHGLTGSAIFTATVWLAQGPPGVLTAGCTAGLVYAGRCGILRGRVELDPISANPHPARHARLAALAPVDLPRRRPPPGNIAPSRNRLAIPPRPAPRPPRPQSARRTPKGPRRRRRQGCRLAVG